MPRRVYLFCRVIEIRKLAAVDLAWLGARIIVPEYVLGVAAPLAFGLVSLAGGLPSGSWFQIVFGLWLLGIGVNYAPLLLYALAIVRAGAVEAEGRPEIVRARRYGTQQVVILVPLLVVALAILQERARRGPSAPAGA